MSDWGLSAYPPQLAAAPMMAMPGAGRGAPMGGAPPMAGGAQQGGYVVCMVPVFVPPGGGPPSIPMQSDCADASMQPQMPQMWGLPMQQMQTGGSVQQVDDSRSRGRGEHENMNGQGHLGSQGQMMPQPQGVMWAGPPVQQNFIMDNRSSQHDSQRRPNGGGGYPNPWDKSVAPFVPSSHRKLDEAQFSTPQSTGHIRSFDKPSPEKPVQAGEGEKKRRALKNARIDKVDKAEKVEKAEKDSSYPTLMQKTPYIPPRKREMMANADAIKSLTNLVKDQSKDIVAAPVAEVSNAAEEVYLEASQQPQRPVAVRSNAVPERKQPQPEPKKEEEPEKPLSVAEYPTLGASTKPKRAARKLSGPLVVEPVAVVEKEVAPVSKPSDDVVEERIKGSAWGKSAAEARKTAAQQRETERAAAEAAAAEDARRRAEEASAASEAAEAESAKEAERKAEEEAKKKADEEAKRKADEEARQQAEEEERQRIADEEAKRQAEAEAKRKLEEEARRVAEEEAKRKAAEEARRQAEEAQRKAEEEARRQAEAEAKRKAEEAQRKAEEEARRQAEAEAKRKAEEEEAKRLAEEAAKRKAEEDAKRKAAEEAKRKAEEEARRKADEEAKRKADEEARRKADEEAKRKADEEAKRKADEEAKRKADEEARRKADEEAKRKADEEARRKADEEAKRKADEEARRKADEEAKRKADEEARRKADEEAQRQAAEEAQRKADEEAERKAREEALQEATAGMSVEACVCGNKFLDDDMFCGKCGAKREAKDAEETGKGTAACESEHAEWIASALAYRGLAPAFPTELGEFSAVVQESDRSKITSEPSDRSLFGTVRTEDRGDRRDRRNGKGGREGRGRDGPARDSRDAREPVETLEALGNKAGNAFKLTDKAGLDAKAELKRCCQALLNKICPENVEKIAKRIKSEAKPSTISEMELVIGLIFKKALAEPHYCETYATMVFMLKEEMPAFPNPDGGKDVTFKYILLNVCQAEFEAMPRKLEASPEEKEQYDVEELEFRRGQQKARFLANMRFIGQLFVQKLLTSKVVAGIMQDLVGCNTGERENVPEEHVVECICELLASIGHTLENMPSGKECITLICGRLLDLKGHKKKDGKGLFSKRVQFAIQDTMEMRSNGWMKKTFKAVAKTKEEVRLQQEQEEKAQKNGKSVSGADFVVAGARPSHLQQADAQTDGPWHEAKKGRR